MVNIGSVSNFTYPAFAASKVILLNNASTDSYNSSLGDYGGSNVSSNGNIGTDSSDPNNITLGNNATVHGSASTGPNGTIQLSSNSAVTGSITHSNNVSMPSVTIPSDLSSLPNLGSISVPSNGSSTISSGNYQYSSISLANNGTLTINGNVKLYLSSAGSAITMDNNCSLVVSSGSQLTVYVNGTVNIANNSVLNNVTRIPADFLLYSTYSGSNGVQISNNGDFYGAVYAPNTDILLGNNAQTFGSFIGKSVDLANNGDIHFDEALKNVPGISSPSSSNYTASNWQEI